MVNFSRILQATAQNGARLVVVSKNNPPEKIRNIYDHGHRIFGENRVQELVSKYEILPKDIEWHLIGHLQTNKVKYIAPFISMVHSVDSLRLLEEINKEALKNNRTIDCLLQFHVAQEETKFGLEMPEAIVLLRSPTFSLLKNVRIKGIMGMGSLSEDVEQVKEEFRCLNEIFKTLKKDFFQNDPNFSEISMGMSGDWELALEKGSTLVRIGSLIMNEF